MSPVQALRLVLIWAAVMILILLSDVATLVPATSRALGTAPATNTPQPTAVSWISQPAPTWARTALERDVRRLHGAFYVPRVVVVSADDEVSPREDRIHVDVQRRWRKPTIVRRLR